MPGCRPIARRCHLAALIATLGALALGVSGCGSGSHRSSPAASAHGNPQTIFTPGSALFDDPTGTIEELHALGVDRVRVFLFWNAIAPKPTSARRPSFDATNPAAYPATGWATYDGIIEDILAHHMSVDVVLGPPAPRWALGTGAPPGRKNAYGDEFWEPDARAFAQFVQAVGTRYSGRYRPHGQHRPLPRVAFWSIWNEPNEGVSLSPQTKDGSSIEVSPRYYRELADVAWSALARTGHGDDTTLIGELAPIGQQDPPKYPGVFSVMTPLRFLRALYCVGGDDKPLAGTAASVRGCPSTSAGAKRFPAANPVLFHATAFADHPYSFGPAPDVQVPNQTDDTDLAEIGQLFQALDRVQAAYGSSRRLPVYDTEYGYQTSPPDTQSANISPRLAASWINWGEYLTWRDPRLLSYDQYLVGDPPPTPGKAYTKFATGIIDYAGRRKPGWYAFRMPIWMPRTTLSGHDPLEVWGCVRPAKILAPAKRPPALVQWRSGSGRAWRTIARVPVRSRYAYFDVDERFPGAGQVRIAWTAPGQGAIHSRVSAITG